jgi:transposase InsO family protein
MQLRTSGQGTVQTYLANSAGRRSAGGHGRLTAAAVGKQAISPDRPNPTAQLERRRGPQGTCFRGETYQTAFTGDDPLLRHVRTRVRSPQTNGVIERFFGTLKYEHLFRAPIDDGGAFAMESARFREIYNRIRPHQSLGDRTPRDACLGVSGRASV